jgi:autotransporter-associated beta strand protein
MSVAAPEAGIAYTGTITPADDTYRLGGGSGTLTLPNPHQLTGDRNLLVANGGEVQLTALNDYTGTTFVNDVPFVSRTNQAIADRTSGISTDMFAPTILTVTSLESGVESSIGTSSNDAGNLVIQGSTLRHVGAGTNTLRLFSIGTRGATIETAGTGQLFFDNTAPLAILPGGAAVSRTLTLAGDAALNGMSPLIADAADGGVVGIAKDGTGTWDLHGDNTYSGPTLVRQGRLNINGTQSGGGSYTVEAGAMLGGTGVIGGDATVVGTLSPGQSVGTLVIDGSVTFDPSSEFVIEIAGIAAGSFDRLEVAGSASLDGSIRIELPDQVGGPYVPKLGDRFAILTAQGGAGEMFDAIESPPLAAGLAWALSPGDVTVFLDVVAALPGDYNFNGIVDAADYTVWRNLLGQEGTGLVADGNHDDRVDEADYGIWKSHFGSTLGSSGQAGGESSVVPEPHSLALIGTVCLSLVALTRRFTT